MKYAIPYTKREPMRLKPHTVVYSKVDKMFFEVVRTNPYSNGEYLARVIQVGTGELIKSGAALINRLDVELVSPMHPVYQMWAARRLQDRLEGLDRT